MSNYIQHSFHLVDESPWPLIRAWGAFRLTTGLVCWFWAGQMYLILNGLFIILLVMAQWWRDVTSEATFQGIHTGIVELGLRWGMGLFIISEVFFFLRFFWAFFHRRLCATVEIGGIWPPLGILTFRPWQVPLLNTLILLSSGVTVTWRHHALIEGMHKERITGLFLTILLGIYFTCLQGFEYFEASFSIADSVYGRTFFIATGFHGLHVLVGTTFLAMCYTRISAGQLRMLHHFGFEAAAWYWHFVDVVWLFLFVSIYWWGGYPASILLWSWYFYKFAFYKKSDNP